MMKTSVPLLAALLVSSPAALAGAPGDVRPPGASAPLAEAEVSGLLAAHPILLLGELHDAPDHHRRQAELLRRMADVHGQVEVVFEMLPQRYQPVLDSVRLNREPPLEDLGAALEADAWLRAGGDGEGELQQARSGGIEGLLDTPAFALLTGRDWPETLQTQMEAEIGAAHCDMIPAEALPLAAGVQRLRDARLAAGVAAARARGHAAVVIAGAGHLRNDRALEWYLPEALQAETLSVAFRPANHAAEDDAPYDLLWFTGARPLVDPCAAFGDPDAKGDEERD